MTIGATRTFRYTTPAYDPPQRESRRSLLFARPPAATLRRRRWRIRQLFLANIEGDATFADDGSPQRLGRPLHRPDRVSDVFGSGALRS